MFDTARIMIIKEQNCTMKRKNEGRISLVYTLHCLAHNLTGAPNTDNQDKPALRNHHILQHFHGTGNEKSQNIEFL